MMVALVLATFASSVSLTGTAHAATGGSWTVYHGNAAGTGVATGVKSVDTSSPRWTSPALNGELYGEPLVDGDDVYVATETDYVYALSALNGRVLWSRQVGAPVPSSSLPCGDIVPDVGITGTPVIDPARHELFVVADELVSASPHHVLVGLSLATGALMTRRTVDPPGSDPAALLQRTGLALDDGQVVFGFGGNYGDCSSYQGRVVAVAEDGASQETFTVDSAKGDSQGAVWMGGAAPVVDAAGHVWVSTGNGSVRQARDPYDDSDGVLELSSSMHLIQFFAPSDWPANNAADLDMSTAPVLLGDSRVVLAGKSGIAYLLNQSHLGGIGHDETSLQVCSANIDGGSAEVGSTIFLPCESGLVAVRTGPGATLHVLWQNAVSTGPAIYAAGLVWTIGQDGVLYGLRPSTGSVVQSANVGAVINHFPTPSVGDGLLLVPTADHVVAYAAS
ncbi:MAG: PQQ-binding-like beta-propeller repeat protein [Acidimicrobiales bacterium]